MKNYQFKNINREDVLRAINYFDKHDLQYSKPRNTFLNFNNKQYPAKFIRKLSYELKYDEQLTNEDLGGGKETADFFIHRGFQMDYHQHRFKNSPENKDLKIGLYLQLEEYKNQKAFDAMRKVIQNANLGCSTG